MVMLLVKKSALVVKWKFSEDQGKNLKVKLNLCNNVNRDCLVYRVICSTILKCCANHVQICTLGRALKMSVGVR